MKRTHGALDSFILECLRSGKYRVERDGRIFVRNWNGTGEEREVRQHPNRHGYLRCHLYLSTSRKSDVMVHRVIALAFLGEPPSPLFEVDHLSTVKSDNRVENLEWVSRESNMGRSFARGTHTSVIHEYRGPKRRSMHKAKLSPDEVRAVHRARMAGAELSEIAAEFTITVSNASMICAGKTWPAIYREFHP